MPGSQSIDSFGFWWLLNLGKERLKTPNKCGEEFILSDGDSLRNFESEDSARLRIKNHK